MSFWYQKKKKKNLPKKYTLPRFAPPPPRWKILATPLSGSTLSVKRNLSLLESDTHENPKPQKELYLDTDYLYSAPYYAHLKNYGVLEPKRRQVDIKLRDA